MMRELHVNRVLSYAGGWEKLREKPHLLADLESAMRDMSESNLRRLTQSNEIQPSSYLRSGDRSLAELGWVEQRCAAQVRAGSTLIIPRVKEHFGVRLLTLNGLYGPTFNEWVLAEVPRAKDSDVCDVSVLFVFSDTESANFDRDLWIDDLITIEQCYTILQDLLPLRSAAPFVVVGVSRFEDPLSVSHLHFDQRAVELSSLIEKSIEFPEDYYQAGVSILSYFGEVLKQKHPHVRAKVRIEQDGLTVRMHIESAGGDRQIIEKTLQEYGMVVAEQLPPSALFDSPLQVLALEQKLELARAEIRYNQKTMAISEGGYLQRISDLRDQISYLQSYIGRQLVQADTLQATLAEQNRTNETLALAHGSHSESMLKALIRQSVENRALFDALTVIDEKLTQGATRDDEALVMKALAVIQRENPSALTRIRSVVANISYEVGGSYVFKWLEMFGRII